MIIARILQRRRRAEVRENDSLPPFPVKEREIGCEELLHSGCAVSRSDAPLYR
jgi:hypothetical protein